MHKNSGSGSVRRTTVPTLVVAGHPDLAQRLRDTGRFPAVFDVASATELRDLSKSGRVPAPAAFMFAPGFDEDLPDVGIAHLANGLAAGGFTVLVHGFFTERGELFDPGVVATSEPMSMSDLLTTLGAAPPPSLAQPDLRPEPSPEPWAPPSETPPGYGELSIVHHGASAVTYRAVHEESGTVVSLRVRCDGTEAPPDELAALDRASQSDHLVTVLEYGITSTGQAYTVSAYSPASAYALGPPLHLQDAVELAVAAGKGLQALHEEGLVHGDVHPGRILHGAEGPLLTGAATLRGLAAHTAPGVLEPVDLERIDPGFAAPEVLRRQSLTEASDVYGLGATLWGMLAGHAPFTADDRWAVRERALNEAVPRVPRDDVPDWLANVLAKAMASEPADRYPTARAFTDALEEGLPEVPAPPTDWEHLLEGSWEEEPAPEPGDLLANQRAAPAAIPVTSGRRSRRRPVVAVAVVLVLVWAGISAARLMAGDGAAERRPEARSSLPEPSPARSSQPPSPSAEPARVPSSTPTAVRTVKEYVPGGVRIVDGRVSIEVTWKDRSRGRAAHFVVGGPTGRAPSTLASAPPGTARVVVAALNPSVDYCLTVVAVMDVDGVAHADPVCTHRVRQGG